MLSRSWDWLCIPLPFATVTYVVENPVAVARDGSAEQLEAALLELEQRLNDAVRVADAAAGVAPQRTVEYIGAVAQQAES